MNTLTLALWIAFVILAALVGYGWGLSVMDHRWRTKR